MASYGDAIANGEALAVPATGDGVRRLRNKAGLSLNIERRISGDLGFFLRAGAQTPGIEAYALTDVSQSVSGGISLTGRRRGRPDDTVGVAGTIDPASRSLRQYLAAGGLGILVGDGALPNSGPEQIFEALDRFALIPGLYVTADCQFVNNPAYNRDRGPVSILGSRVHVQF